jgi:predicted signal transduction protein with EAL and GGDEF domain
MDLEGHQVHVAASLGVAIFPEDAQELEALCIKADLRMYDNKRGVETHRPHPPTSQPAVGQHQSESARL